LKKVLNSKKSNRYIMMFSSGKSKFYGHKLFRLKGVFERML
jgi:hypothetical protein